MTESDLLLSPHVIALLREATSGNEAALDLFWQKMEVEGAPLLESIPDDTSHVLATFLYRAPLDGCSVEVMSALAGRGEIKEPMTRLLTTSLWYKTYRVRRGLRTEYQFFVDGVARPDPLNARTLTFPADEDAFFDKTVPESWFEVPPVEASSWLTSESGNFARRLTRVCLKSEVLGNERPLSIYTPPVDAHSRQPEHVLILFDRWAYAHVLPTAAMIDRLIADGSIPPILIVMVGHPDDSARFVELGCYTPFAAFLAQELLPWIGQQYHVNLQPGKTVVGGMSKGGLAAAYAGLRYPEMFGKVFSQSGSFYWKPDTEEEYEWIARQLAAIPRLPLQWHISVGLLETHVHMGGRPNLLVANRHLRDVLQAKGYPLHYTEFNGGHSFVWQLPCLAEGLRVLVGPGKTKEQC